MERTTIAELQRSATELGKLTGHEFKVFPSTSGWVKGWELWTVKNGKTHLGFVTLEGTITECHTQLKAAIKIIKRLADLNEKMQASVKPT